MTDDPVAGGFLVFFEKIFCARKGDLRDIFFHFVGSHADAVVLHGQRFGLLVNEHVDAVFFAFGRLRFAHFRQLLELGDGVHAVGDDLAKENILVGI